MTAREAQEQPGRAASTQPDTVLEKMIKANTRWALVHHGTIRTVNSSVRRSRTDAWSHQLVLIYIYLYIYYYKSIQWVMYKVWQNKKKKSSFNVFQQTPLARHRFWSIMSPVMSMFHAKGVIPYRQPTAVFDMDSWTHGPGFASDQKCQQSPSWVRVQF